MTGKRMPGDPSRRPVHQRDEELEHLLRDLNDIVERGAAPPRWQDSPVHPLVFVVGCGRSGTTLLMQWLAASGRFAYPTNLASRLYASPRTGALLHRVLVDLDHRNEVFRTDDDLGEPDSVLGKTKGARQPNEYWYWWRRFFTFGDVQVLAADDLAKVDIARMRHELAEYTKVMDRPLAMKAMILNWHLPFLSGVFERSVFVHVSRDVLANASSLLRAREEFFGTSAGWYSFKPPEYEWLRHESPESQVVGQVLATETAVAEGLRSIAPERVVRVRYESFCANPAGVWEGLAAALARFGAAIGPYSGAPAFPVRGSTSHPRALGEAYARLRGRFGE